MRDFSARLDFVSSIFNAMEASNESSDRSLLDDFYQVVHVLEFTVVFNHLLIQQNRQNLFDNQMPPQSPGVFWFTILLPFQKSG